MLSALTTPIIFSVYSRSVDAALSLCTGSKAGLKQEGGEKITMERDRPALTLKVFVTFLQKPSKFTPRIEQIVMISF